MKGFVYKRTSIVAMIAGAQLMTGCALMAEKTNTLTDERILSETSGALGYAPADLTLVSRRTSGTNTYVALKAKDGKEFNCIINGGNWVSFGATNPPSCAKKGEVLRAGPPGM